MVSRQGDSFLAWFMAMLLLVALIVTFWVGIAAVQSLEKRIGEVELKQTTQARQTSQSLSDLLGRVGWLEESQKAHEAPPPEPGDGS